MAAPPKKRGRLSDYGKDSYVSASGLKALLDQVREHGLPEHFSERTQARAKQAVASQSTSWPSPAALRCV
eukprot:9479815-Pyramimonas_sp.AAC.2